MCEDLKYKKEKVVDIINFILKEVQLEESLLTKFFPEKYNKLEQLEEEYNIIGIVNNNDNWGINIITLLNTMIKILVDDNIIFITDKGIIKEVMWDSTFKTY